MCKEECDPDVYIEHCQDWCTNGDGNCDYCDELFTEPCQSDHLTYENCALSLDCEDLDDATDFCEDERDAVLDACNNF